MSLITCCPACGTMFKVVADQLKISEGWVRCGHCAQVFDAQAHMVREGATASADASQTSGGAPSAAAAHDAPTPSAKREEEGYVLDRESIEGDAPRDDGFRIESGMTAGGAEQLKQAEAEAAQADAELREVSFMRDARRRAFWSRPLVRTFLVLVLLALAALLAAQYAVQERNRLAATHPALKPWLEQLCAPLNCSIGAARRIDAVAIDSSTFAKVRGDTYRLAFTVKNTANFAVAAPSMELTLTDTQEQAVVRRVLAPSELGAPNALVPANGEWAANVTLTVSAAGGNRISGYRLLAFYP